MRAERRHNDAESYLSTARKEVVAVRGAGLPGDVEGPSRPRRCGMWGRPHGEGRGHDRSRSGGSRRGGPSPFEENVIRMSAPCRRSVSAAGSLKRGSAPVSLSSTAGF